MTFIWDWRRNGAMIKREATKLASWWNEHDAGHLYQVRRDPRYAKRKKLYCVHQFIRG